MRVLVSHGPLGFMLVVAALAGAASLESQLLREGQHMTGLAPPIKETRQSYCYSMQGTSQHTGASAGSCTGCPHTNTDEVEALHAPHCLKA